MSTARFVKFSFLVVVLSHVKHFEIDIELPSIRSDIKEFYTYKILVTFDLVSLIIFSCSESIKKIRNS